MLYLPWIIVVITLISIVLLLLPRPGREDPSAIQAVTSRTGIRQVPRIGEASVVLPSVRTPERMTGTLLTGTKRGKQTLRERLIQAGLYRESFILFLSLSRYVGVGLAVVTGFLMSSTQIVSPAMGIFLGCCAGGIATVAPSFLLDYRKARRQAAIRRALPDALDALIICLEAGLSLKIAFSRIAKELATAHPLLAVELRIVEREVRVGHSLSSAIRNFAARFDLDELRSLASSVAHADRYGSSVTRGFRVFADGIRIKRQQMAEERAHKAAVKMIFPTVLCILPALFVISLGPAVYKAKQTLIPILRSEARLDPR
jgi:tight adherence protein C